MFFCKLFLLCSVSYCLFESVGCLLCITGSGVYLGFLFERGGLEETHQGYIVRLQG